MVDSVTLPSSVSWVQFQEEMCTVMTLRVKDLKLGYKFSTQPQREAPRILSTPAAFIKMKDGAVTQICEREKSAGKGKKGKHKDGFRVILIDSGKKAHEKAAPTKGKVFIHMFSPFRATDFTEHPRRTPVPRDPHWRRKNHLKRGPENTKVFSYRNMHAPPIHAYAILSPTLITRPSHTVTWAYGLQ